MSVTSVPVDFNRDWQQRPLIIPPAGGKATAYRRTTTHVGVLEDLYMLQQWEKRQVALGLADRPDLLLAVSAHRDDKRKLNALCNDAKDAAKASAKSVTGTALHALTDVIDRGATLPPLPEGPKASLEAFRAATAPLKVIAIEQQLVLDTQKVAGTADRIYEVNGHRYIGDTKSGSIELGILKICMQLAVYARSQTYDVATGARGTHGCEVGRGIVMHMPSTDDPAQARCDLLWVDLETGWEAVKVARQVWEMRGHKFEDLTAPFIPGEKVRPSLRLQHRDYARDLEESLLEAIRACPTRQAVTELWSGHAADWTPRMTEVAKQHIATMPTEGAA